MTSIREIPTPDQHPAVADRRRRLAEAEVRLVSARATLDAIHASVEGTEDAAARAALAGEPPPEELATLLDSIAPAESAVRVADRAASLAAADLSDSLYAAEAAYATEVRNALAAASRGWGRQARELARASAAVLDGRAHVEATSARGVLASMPYCPTAISPPILLALAQAFDAWATMGGE